MVFDRRNLVARALYWRNDRRLNIEGNTAVAHILLDRLPHIFGTEKPDQAQ